jgi:hypothetical protein
MPPVLQHRRRKGGSKLIIETEYGFVYDGVEYATYSEAEEAKNASK